MHNVGKKKNSESFDRCPSSLENKQLYSHSHEKTNRYYKDLSFNYFDNENIQFEDPLIKKQLGATLIIINSKPSLRRAIHHIKLVENSSLHKKK